jgi:2'-5' RNA ligase
MGIRSFLAFELPSDIKNIIAGLSVEIRKSVNDVRWVKVDNIHLTVVFMGNIAAEDIEPIGDRVKEVCFRYAPFRVSLSGVGAFPNSRKPRVLWLGLNGDIERMARFRDDLQEQLRPFGIKEETRRFKPHLTLGRFRKFGKRDSRFDEIISSYRDVASPVCSFNELILFKSDLKPNGAVYTKLKSCPLPEEK